MIYEHSAGAVVFTRINNEIKYVIIRSPQGFYGFPKGHIEAGESEVQAALREVSEEVGLSVSILPDFRTEDAHPIPNKKDVIKHIVYFAAEYADQEIKFQREELLGAELMSFDEAMAAFQFENSKRIMVEAHTFITNYIRGNHEN